MIRVRLEDTRARQATACSLAPWEWPQYEHVAVIVAGEITARFFDVISLFNGFIPIIAIQVSAIEMGAVTLVSHHRP